MARRVLVVRAAILLEPPVAAGLTGRRTAAVATDRDSHPIRSASLAGSVLLLPPAAGHGDRRWHRIKSCSLPTRSSAIRFETATSRRINPAHNAVGGCARGLREVACRGSEGDPRSAPLHNRVSIHTGLRGYREAGQAIAPRRTIHRSRFQWLTSPYPLSHPSVFVRTHLLTGASGSTPRASPRVRSVGSRTAGSMIATLGRSETPRNGSV